MIQFLFLALIFSNNIFAQEKKVWVRLLDFPDRTNHEPNPYREEYTHFYKLEWHGVFTRTDLPPIKELFLTFDKVGSTNIPLIWCDVRKWNNDNEIYIDITKEDTRVLSNEGLDLLIPKGSMKFDDHYLVDYKEPTAVTIPTNFAYGELGPTRKLELKGKFFFRFSKVGLQYLTGFIGHPHSIKLLEDVPIISSQGILAGPHLMPHETLSIAPLDGEWYKPSMVIGVLPRGTRLENVNAWTSSYLLFGNKLRGLENIIVLNGGTDVNYGVPFLPLSIFPPRPMKLKLLKVIADEVRNEILSTEEITFRDFKYMQGEPEHFYFGNTTWTGIITGGTLDKSTRMKLAPNCSSDKVENRLRYFYSYDEQNALFKAGTHLELNNNSLNQFANGPIVGRINPYMATSGVLEESIFVRNFKLIPPRKSRPFSTSNPYENSREVYHCHARLFSGRKLMAGDRFTQF